MHKTVVIPNHVLTTYQLRQIYSMRQLYWSNGQPIIVYVLPSDAVLHQQFSKEVLKIFPYQLDRIWRKLTFSGLGKAPVVVNTADELKVAVEKTQGAIGYVTRYGKSSNANVIMIKD